MLTLFAQSLAIAATGIIAPGSITLVILLLMSDRGWPNGLSFMFGYIVSYAVIGVSVLTLEIGWGRGSPHERHLIISLGLVILGVILLIIAIFNLLRRPRSDSGEGHPSIFTRLIGDVNPLKSFAIAAAFSVINIKNFATFVAAASALGLSRLPFPTKLGLLLPVLFVFCLSVIIPVFIYRAFPLQATVYLSRIKDTISRYGPQIVFGFLLLFSAIFLYNGVIGLFGKFGPQHPPPFF